MRLDIYRRPETAGMFSYLAVPEGNFIPEEATNCDWQTARRGFEFNESEHRLPDFLIDEPLQQINDKGYAITSVKNFYRR
jgi:hypothetical protein